MIDNEVTNAQVVVSRWYVSKISHRRFPHINDAGVSALKNMHVPDILWTHQSVLGAGDFFVYISSNFSITTFYGVPHSYALSFKGNHDIIYHLRCFIKKKKTL